MLVSREVYSQDSIIISEIIGRTYNNPLGPKVIPLIESALPKTENTLELLDIGCGRGAIACELAKLDNIKITAIDISEDMLERAKTRSEELNVVDKIQWLHGSFLDVNFNDYYDLVYSFDVFSYFPNKETLFKKITSLIKPDCKIIFSDYFSDDPNNKQVRNLLTAWQLATPGPYIEYFEILNNMGFKNIIQHNSTDIYYHHWMDIKKKLDQLKESILKKVALDSYKLYYQSVESILNAVETKKFGHTILHAQI